MFESIVDVLKMRAGQANKIAFTFINEDSDRPSLSYQELDQDARRLAQELLTLVEPGEPVILMLPQGLDYVRAFFGCLYAGVVAVPLYPAPDLKKNRRIASVIEDCSARFVLTEEGIAADSRQTTVGKIAVVAVATDIVHAQRAMSTDPSDEPVAFLQYTSGSTGNPKGVMVSHSNIVANLVSLVEAAKCSEDDVFCNWLPLFHDLGLINTLLLPVFVGAHSVLMAPYRFVRNPIRWLEAITQYKATICGSPNFSFDLCNERVAPDALMNLDLSSWRVAFNAAEPINPVTLNRFEQKFATCGFNGNAFYPSYGMAEATVFISGGRPGEGARLINICPVALQHNRVVLSEDVEAENSEGSLTLVSCGAAQSKHDLVIVDQTTGEEVDDLVVGEVWFSGPSVAKGYWGKGTESNRTFCGVLNSRGKRFYLRTGDLGFIHRGEVYISGRIKDVLIIKGRNYYPHDIERVAVESNHCFRSGAAAAFQVSERVVVVLEVSRGALPNFHMQEARRAVVDSLLDEFEVLIHDVLFVKAGQLPRTSSGKMQRSLAKKMYLGNEFQHLPNVAVKTEPTGSEANADERRRREDLLAKAWKEVLEINAVSPSDNFFHLGGDSLGVLMLVSEMRSHGLNYSASDLFSNPTFAELAALCVENRSEIVEPAFAGNAPLSVEQQNFFKAVTLEPHRANVSVMFHFEDGLDLDSLGTALNEVWAHHDALRARFECTDSGWAQVIDSTDRVHMNVEYIDYSLLDEVERLDTTRAHVIATQEVMDLNKTPLARAWVYDHGDRGHVFRLMMHHLLVDGFSLRIVLEDIARAYNALRAGQPVKLPAKTTPMHEWMMALREYIRLSESSLREAINRNRLLETQPSIPLDFPENTHLNTYESYDSATRVISRDCVNELVGQVSSATDIPLINIVVYAVSMAIRDTFEMNRFAIAVLDSGRMMNVVKKMDLSRTVGWLSLNRQFIVDISHQSLSAMQMLKLLNQQIQEAPLNGMAHELLKFLNSEDELWVSDQPQLWVNYHGRNFSPAEMNIFTKSYFTGGHIPWVNPLNARPCLLFCNFVLSNGALEVSIEYSKNLHRTETIQNFLSGIRRHLEALASFCTDQTLLSINTPADL